MITEMNSRILLINLGWNILNNWNLIFIKLEKIYEKFKFSLNGSKFPLNIWPFDLAQQNSHFIDFDNKYI